MIKRFAIALAVVVAMPAGIGRIRADILDELKVKSSTHGLAIAFVSNREITIIPFGRSAFSMTSFGFNFFLARMTSDGKRMLVSLLERNAKFGLLQNQIVLLDTRGEVLSVLRHEFINVIEMALSPDNDKVALLGQDRDTGNVGLFLGGFSSGDVALVEPLNSYNGVPEESTIGWAADGQQIVFSKLGQISTYDLKSKSFARLARGRNPTWSPDGKWIGFQTLDGFPKIISPNSTASRAIGRGEKIYASLHWSPDSEYVFVDEHWGVLNPFCDNSRLVVYRLRDNAYAAVYNPCLRKDSFYGWIIAPELLKTQ